MVGGLDSMTARRVARKLRRCQAVCHGVNLRTAALLCGIDDDDLALVLHQQVTA
jgi:hypothetical protein